MSSNNTAQHEPAADMSCVHRAEVRTGQGRNPFKRLAAAVSDAVSAIRAGVPNWRRYNWRISAHLQRTRAHTGNGLHSCNPLGEVQQWALIHHT